MNRNSERIPRSLLRGSSITTIELKQIDLPREMQRAMARQAEAERDRRAKVINHFSHSHRFVSALSQVDG